MTFRTYRIALPIVAALALMASGQNAFAKKPPEAPVTPVTLPAPPAGQGQVVFFRKGEVSLVPFNWMVREGTVELCRMVAGTYCIATVAPGAHTFEVHSEATDKLTLEVDAGETYYVVGSISMGLIVARNHIAPAQKPQFDAISGKLKVEPAQPGGGGPPAPAKPAA